MNEVLYDEFQPGQFIRSLVHIAKMVIMNPNLFFPRMKRGGGLVNPTLFLLSCSLIHSLILGLWLRKPGLMLTGFLSGILIPFVHAGIILLLLRMLFRVEGSYELSFRINAYASAAALLSWVPVLGFLIELYRLFVISLGVKQLFGVSLVRAVTAVLLGVVVLIFLYWIFAQAVGIAPVKPS